MKRLLLVSAICMLSGLHAFAQNDKYVHVRIEELMNMKAKLLTNDEQIGHINKAQFEKRFKKEEGASRILAYMDSLGYQPIYMGKATASLFDIIFKKQ